MQEINARVLERVARELRKLSRDAPIKDKEALGWAAYEVEQVLKIEMDEVVSGKVMHPKTVTQVEDGWNATF